MLDQPLLILPHWKSTFQALTLPRNGKLRQLKFLAHLATRNKILQLKFRRSGVPTRDSFSRRILKVCVLGWVKARYWKPKFVFRFFSPAGICSNITVHTQILIRVMTIFSQITSSRVITPDLAWYSTLNNTRIPSFFRIAQRGRVIRRNLLQLF